MESMDCTHLAGSACKLWTYLLTPPSHPEIPGGQIRGQKFGIGLTWQTQHVILGLTCRVCQISPPTQSDPNFPKTVIFVCIETNCDDWNIYFKMYFCFILEPAQLLVHSTYVWFLHEPEMLNALWLSNFWFGLKTHWLWAKMASYFWDRYQRDHRACSYS